MDERDGRMRALELGVNTIGVMGVLLVGKKSGSISSVKDEILRLRVEAGFFITAKLENQVIDLAGE